jgi:Ser/Thr protein kinase RdoA (MazF antagonist)
MRALGPCGTAIVKQYDSDRASRVATRVAALSNGPAEPMTPHVLAVLPDIRTVVLSDIPGVALAESFAAAPRAGRAIGAWHDFWRRGTPSELSTHTAGRELEVLDAWRARATPAMADHVARLRRQLDQVQWAASTVVHRDLYEHQVMVGDRIGLIDLDDAALGPPELDVGNLLAHLHLLSHHVEEAASCERALLDGYRETGPPLDDELLAACFALACCRLACIHGVVVADEPLRTTASM